MNDLDISPGNQQPFPREKACTTYAQARMGRSNAYQAVNGNTRRGYQRPVEDIKEEEKHYETW